MLELHESFYKTVTAEWNVSTKLCSFELLHVNFN